MEIILPVWFVDIIALDANTIPGAAEELALKLDINEVRVGQIQLGWIESFTLDRLLWDMPNDLTKVWNLRFFKSFFVYTLTTNNRLSF